MSKGYDTSKAYDATKQYVTKSQDWSVGSGMVLQPAQGVAVTLPGIMYGSGSQQGISVNTGYPYGQQSMFVNQTPGMFKFLN